MKSFNVEVSTNKTNIILDSMLDIKDPVVLTIGYVDTVLGCMVGHTGSNNSFIVMDGRTDGYKIIIMFLKNILEELGYEDTMFLNKTIATMLDVCKAIFGRCPGTNDDCLKYKVNLIIK